MKHVRALAACILLALAAVSAFAQDQPPMTAKELDKFIADWPSVVGWFEERGKDFDSDELSSGLGAAFTASADFSAFLKGKGWKAERFEYVAGTTFATLAFVHMEKANPDMVKELDEAIAETRKNPALDADTKAQMIKAFEEAKKSLFAIPDEAKISEAELRLVRAKYDALARLFELED